MRGDTPQCPLDREDSSPLLLRTKISMVDPGLLAAGHKAGMASVLFVYLLFNRN